MTFKLQLGHLYIDAHENVSGRTFWLIGWRNTNHAGGYSLREILTSAWRELLFYAGVT